MKKNKKTLLFIISMILILVIVGCSGKSNSEVTDNGDDDEKYDLRLATIVNKPHPWIDMAEYFAEEVEEKTDGNVIVTINSGGTLGNDEAVIEEQLIGSVDFSIGSTQNIASFVPEYQIFNLGYVFEDMDQFEEAIDVESEIFKIFDTLYEEKGHNLKLLGISGGGTRNFAHKSIDVKEAADVSGEKMRLAGSPIETKLWSAIGAIPTSLSFDEIYSALQTGTVDSFESTLSAYNGNKLNEVAPHIAKTEHVFMASHFTMSGLTVDKLPDEYNKIIEEVAKEASLLGTEKGKEYDEEFAIELEDKGVTFSEVDKESFIQEFAPLHDELAESINATEILEMIRNMK